MTVRHLNKIGIPASENLVDGKQAIKDSLAGVADDGSLVSPAEVESVRAKMTIDGGFAVKKFNRTGVVTVRGQLGKTDPATDNGVILTGVGDTECFGVWLDDGVADDAEGWFVTGGDAYVRFDDNFGPNSGDWVETSEAGYANSQATPAAAPTHFQEIGHCMETVGAGGGGTHVLALCALHFN